MRATGVLRRIDELGRIVIPKEIRKNLHIHDGDPMEIFTDDNGEIILKKHSALGELSDFAQQYADSAAKTLGCGICISDMDQIIAVSGLPKKELLGSRIHNELQNLIFNRDSVISNENDSSRIKITDNDNDFFKNQAIQTIICEGDAIGAVILTAKDSSKRLGDLEMKSATVAANFLGKQVES